MLWELDISKPVEENNQEVVTVQASPIELPIDDDALRSLIDDHIKESNSFFDSIRLKERRKKNKEFFLGKQINEEDFDNYQVPYVDNLIYRNLGHRIAMAAGRMPDILTGPADNSEQSLQRAKKFESFLSKKLTNDVTHRLVKDGLRDNHLSFIGVIKARWDKNKGEHGDFTFDLVRPDRIGFDHTATIPQDGFTADNMDLIWEDVEEPLSVVLAKFPNAKGKLLAATGADKDKRKIASKIKYKEVWFTWYSSSGEQYEGVAWKYQNEILGKRKHPYYDWEGYEASMSDVLGQPSVGKQYRNHLSRPRKPYIFFSYENLGDGPVDDTTPVEQSIKPQQTINKRGRQITELADNSVPRKVFAGKYITKEQTSRISNDPNEHIWLEGATNASQAITTVQANPPSPILYQDLISNRNEVDAMFATSSTTRGDTVPQESGVSKQISREGNLTISDDISKIVVERVVFEMANWATQLMKMFYKDTHYIREMGQDGEAVYVDLHQDEIDDGISISVKANSVDKAQRRADALELAGSKAIDPLSLFEDLDLPNPKDRAARLIAWLNGGADGYARYQALIGVDANAPEEGKSIGSGNQSNPQDDIKALIQGQPVNPQGIDENYLRQFAQFVSSPEFMQLPPDAHKRILDFVQGLQQQASKVSQPIVAPPSSPVTAPQTLTPQPMGATV